MSAARAPAEDPTIFRAYVGQAQAAQLFRRKTLQPEQSGYGQFQSSIIAPSPDDLITL